MNTADSISTWFSLVRRRAPKALASDRVFGRGNFALTSCPFDDTVRRVNFFETEEARNQFEQTNPVCGAPTCVGDHREFHLLEQTCAFTGCARRFVPKDSEIFCSARCRRRDDAEGPR